MGARRFLLLFFLGIWTPAGCAGVSMLAAPNRAFDPAGPPLAAPDPGRVLVWLALSGGGARAAALAYGAMEELEEIKLTGETGGGSNLLREVDYISSVSGGSFAAAFYALHRDRKPEDDGDWKSSFKKREIGRASCR